MKKYIILLMVLIFSVSTIFLGVGCKEEVTEVTEGAEEIEQEELRMVMVSPLVNHPIFVRIYEGFACAGEEYGFEASMIGPDDLSMDTMIEAMETAIVEKVDGIVMYPMSPSAFTPVLEKAKEAGIKIGCFFSDAEREELRDSFTGTDSFLCGKDMAEAAYAKVNGPIKVGIIMSALDTQDELNQVDGIKSVMEELPDSEILTIVKDDADLIIAEEELTAMIKTYPEMNCVLCTEGGGAPALGKVLDEFNLTDKIVIIAMDDIDQNLQTVRDGLIYGIMAQGFHEFGYLNGINLVAAIKGEEFVAKNLIPGKLVTKENIDTLYPEN